MYWDTFHRRSVSRRRLIATGGATAVGVGVAGLVGCGGGEQTGGATARTGTAATTRQPKRGGTLRLSGFLGQVDFTHLDPHLEAGSGLPRLGSYEYQQLVRKKESPKNTIYDYPVEGDLAQSWEQPDHQTYIFKLYPNAKWQTISPVNGRAVTADDVVYSADRQIGLKVTAAFQAGVRSYTAVDPNTVKVELNKPDPDWLVAMTDTHNKVIAHEVVDLKGDLKQLAIGSAAWIMKEWKQGSFQAFTRNPDYYRQAPDGKPFPYADELYVPRILDQSTVAAAFRTKQLYAFTAPSRVLDEVRPSITDMQISESTIVGPAATNLVLRTDIPPTNDIRVRQAISKTIDRQAIIKAILDGHAWLGGSLMAASTRDDWLSDDELKKLLAPDPAGAKQLLEQAGFKGWKQNVGTYGTPGSSYYDSAELVQAEVRAIGIEGALEALDITAFGKYLADHNKQIWVGPRGPNVPNAPNADLQNSYKTGAVRNVANLSDAELDRLIDAQAVEFNIEKRRQIFYQIQRKLIELAAVVPVLTAISLTARWGFVKDFFGTGDSASAYEQMWLDQ